VERFPTLTPRPALFPTGVTILKALVVARWLAWAWMAGIVAFSNADVVRHPVVAWLAVAATFGLTATSTALVRNQPARLLHLGFVLADVGFAVGLSIVDGYVFEPGHVFATTQSIATQWPLISMATAGVAYGPIIAASLGLSIGPAEWVGALLNDFHDWGAPQIVSIVATSLFFAACGAVFGWQARLLKRVEGEIADRRARDEVGRILHDTVLQTLALVARRSAAGDPELAAAARDADRDLRAFLFGSAGRALADLDARIRSEVERVQRGHPTPVTVSVIDDGCRLSSDDQDRFARAIGEAVANALQHADATRVIVFAETDDAGQVFASVNDDGRGFDPSAPRTSHGLDESVIGRIEAIGGRVQVASSPGAGTEICLWSSAG
jgi:signal transduction histidine kinase